MNDATTAGSPDGPPSPKRRGRKKRPAVVPEQVVGRRNVLMLQRHLDRLRAHHAHGNRIVHFDNLLLGLLLSFYNPTCRSLRTIEGLSHVAQDELGVDRLCRSTTSDAMALFDPVDLANTLSFLTPGQYWRIAHSA
ncbi:MAG: hypothetical protein PHU85_17775 [Phycisphaerae bacterium]|nr:hypothetical protein [Phycisphaerae bacterium]